MNKKNYTTLNDIFHNPVKAGIKWTDIEALFISLGATITEGNGSRVRVLLMENAQFSIDPILKILLIKEQ